MNKSISRNLCIKCVKVQESCCSYGHPPLMLSDIKTIENLGFKLKDFAEISEYTKNELKDDAKWWIKSMIKINNKSFKITIKKEGQYCIFLKDNKGCILANKRPVICQMYPFWVENDKLVPSSNDCYLVKNKMPIKTILEIIGETEDSIKMRYNLFKEDAIKNHKSHKKIVYELYKKI